MTTEVALDQLLSYLDGVSKEPLVEEFRVAKAEATLKQRDLSVAQAVQALRSPQLPWNQRKASALGVDVATWLAAQEAVELPQAATAAELLRRLRHAESAASMLKAGYRPSRDLNGKLAWSSPSTA